VIELAFFNTYFELYLCMSDLYPALFHSFFGAGVCLSLYHINHIIYNMYHSHYFYSVNKLFNMTYIVTYIFTKMCRLIFLWM